MMTAQRRRCGPPAPIAGSAAACWPRSPRDGRVAIARRPRPSGQFRPALLQGLGARRDASVSTAGCCIREIDGKRAGWDAALDLVAARFRRRHRRARPGLGRLLRLRPVADRGLLRRQQADEGLHRHRPISTPIRGCAWPRRSPAIAAPSAATPCRAPTRISSRPISSCWSAPTSPGAIRCSTSASRRPSRRGRSMKVVVIDPRRTATADIADLHLPIRPDGDVALFNGLLRPSCAERGAIDRAYVERHTSGFAAALATPRTRPRRRRRLTGLDAAAAARLLSRCSPRTRKVVTVYSQGVNQSAPGTDKVNAIINCHLATGRIGQPGMGPFSRHRPAQRHGRARGRRPRQHAGRAYGDRESRRIAIACGASGMRRASPSEPGLKAVDMFQAVARRAHQGAVDHGDQPGRFACPMPTRVRAALAACPFVVVSDVHGRDRHDRATPHVQLPAAAWGEKDGTVTNSERRISRQRAFLPAPGEARADWWTICEVGKRMGLAGLRLSPRRPRSSPSTPRCPAFENDGTRDFDIGAWAMIDAQAYDAHDAIPVAAIRRRADRATRASSPMAASTRRTAARASSPCAPLAATPAGTGCPMIAEHRPRARPLAHHDAHRQKPAPVAAHGRALCRIASQPMPQRLGIADADIVRVSSDHGEVLVRALIGSRQQPGSVFVPMHWNDQFAARARIDTLVPPLTDPISGQPALQECGSAGREIRRRCLWLRGHAAQALQHRRPTTGPWPAAPKAGGWNWRWRTAPADWSEFARSLFGVGGEASVLAYSDSATGQHRVAVFERERLVGALFTASEPVAVSRSWAVQQLALAHADGARQVVGRRRAGRRQCARHRRHRLLVLWRRRQPDRRRSGARRGKRRRDRQGFEGRNAIAARAAPKSGAIIDAHRLQAAE